METRSLNGTNLTVSRACLGTMTFGAQADRSMACRILQCALDAGIDFVDTANVYAGGESERILGELLAGRRQNLVLASKIGMKVGDEQPGLSRYAILAAVESSLARLRTDYLDICYFHLPDEAVPLEESLEAMDTLVRQGKVRYPGTSNFASWQVSRVLELAGKHGYTPARIAQPMYNLLARRIEDEFLDACRALGISTVVYNPLGGGLLTGKHNGHGPLPGTRFDGNAAYLNRYWNESNHRAVRRLASAAAGRSLVSLALNWLLHHTSIDAVILGASTVGQLRENLAALDDGPLDDAALDACHEIALEQRGSWPKYNR